jgi:hypothetical protein
MSVLLGVIAFRVAATARSEGLDPGVWSISSFTTWACLFWCAVIPFFFAQGVRERASRLAVTLPVASRRLWVTHLVAVIGFGAAIFVVAAGFVALNSSLLIFLFRGRNIFEPEVFKLAVYLGTGLILTTVLLQCPKPSLQMLPPNKGYFLYTAATLLGVLGLIVVLGSLPLPFVLILLGAALAIGWRTYHQLPATFSLIPREAESHRIAANREDPARTSRGLAFGSLLQRTILRSLYGSWLQYWWLVTPFTFGMGILLAGVTWIEDSYLYYMRFTLIPITVYMILAFVGQPLRNLYRLDPLPISRKWLFAVTILPTLLVLSLGYGAGKIWEAMSPPRELVSYRMDPDSHYYVYVPARADKIAWDGQPPESSSPWGETHEAWSTPICQGCRAVIYSPFHTPIGSSLDFVALQISRASEALYSESVPPEKIKDRYLSVDDEGNVVLKGENLSLQADFPHLTPRSNGPIFPVMLTLVGLAWAFLVYIFLRSFRATISDGKRKALLFGLMFLLLAVHIAQYALVIGGITMDWIITGTIEILVRQASDGLAGGALLIWLVCGLLLYGGYRFAESGYLRIEVPPIPPKMNPVEALFSN